MNSPRGGVLLEPADSFAFYKKGYELFKSINYYSDDQQLQYYIGYYRW